MSFKVSVSLLCLALAVIAVPAAGYATYAADILGPDGYSPAAGSGWVDMARLYSAYDASKASVGLVPQVAVVPQALEFAKYDPAPFASGTAAQANHVTWLMQNTGDSWGGVATAQIRFKTTATQAFQTPDPAATTYQTVGQWENVMMLTSSTGKAVRLTVMAPGTTSGGATTSGYVCVTNSNESTWYGFVPGSNAGGGGNNMLQTLNNGFVYDGRIGFADFGGRTGTSVIPVDTSVYHTYTLIMKNNGLNFNLMIDGLSVFGNDVNGIPLDMSVNSSTEGAMKPGGANVEGLMIGMQNLNNTAGPAPLNQKSSGTGSVAISWVGVKGGADYAWTAIPEPGSLLALSTGLIGLIGLVRRKKA